VGAKVSYCGAQDGLVKTLVMQMPKERDCQEKEAELPPEMIPLTELESQAS